MSNRKRKVRALALRAAIMVAAMRRLKEIVAKDPKRKKSQTH